MAQRGELRRRIGNETGVLRAGRPEIIWDRNLQCTAPREIPTLRYQARRSIDPASVECHGVLSARRHPGRILLHMIAFIVPTPIGYQVHPLGIMKGQCVGSTRLPSRNIFVVQRSNRAVYKEIAASGGWAKHEILQHNVTVTSGPNSDLVVGNSPL